MTRKEALELSANKWQMIVDSNGQMTVQIRSKFAGFKNRCPLCDLYFGCGECEGCPINLDKTDCACEANGHPFNNWRMALDDKDEKAAAQKVLDLIKSKL
jgi:hypothetical protein